MSNNSEGASPTNTNSVTTSNRSVSIPMLIISTVLLIVGGFFTYKAFHTTPTGTPDLSTAATAPANQKAVGSDSIPGEAAAKHMKPNHILIPSIKVYATIDEKTGALASHQLILPEASKVTRWQGGSTVTSPHGTVLIAGHVSWNGNPGALYKLAKAPLGAQAWVTDAQGHRERFQLRSKTPYKKTALPRNIWSAGGAKKLIVVTCGGKLHLVEGAWHFDSNIVTEWFPTGS